MTGALSDSGKDMMKSVPAVKDFRPTRAPSIIVVPAFLNGWNLQRGLAKSKVHSNLVPGSHVLYTVTSLTVYVCDELKEIPLLILPDGELPRKPISPPRFHENPDSYPVDDWVVAGELRCICMPGVSGVVVSFTKSPYHSHTFAMVLKLLVITLQEYISL